MGGSLPISTCSSMQSPHGWRAPMSIEERVSELFRQLDQAPAFEQRGKGKTALGTSIRVTGITARVGQACALLGRSGEPALPAEVVGLHDGEVILAPLGDLRGLSSETEVVIRVGEDRVPVSDALLGRVLDARMQP